MVYFLNWVQHFLCICLTFCISSGCFSGARPAMPLRCRQYSERGGEGPRRGASEALWGVGLSSFLFSWSHTRRHLLVPPQDVPLHPSGSEKSLPTTCTLHQGTVTLSLSLFRFLSCLPVHTWFYFCLSIYMYCSVDISAKCCDWSTHTNVQAFWMQLLLSLLGRGTVLKSREELIELESYFGHCSFYRIGFFF